MVDDVCEYVKSNFVWYKVFCDVEFVDVLF